MRLTLTIIILIFGLQTTKSQNLIVGNAFGEAKSGAMATETGLNSIGYNPAGIYATDFGIEVTYFDWYGLKEMSQKSAVVAIPALKGCFSTSFDYYGFELYNELKAGLSYAMRLSKEIKAGIRINYHNLHINDSQDNCNAATAEVGVIYTPIERVDIGAYIKNPTNSQFNDNDTLINTSLSIGIKYKFYNSGNVNLDVEKSANEDKIDIKLGFDSEIGKNLVVIGGIGSFPFRASFGIGVGVKQFQMIMGGSRNEHLGWSPTVSVRWYRNNKEK